MQITLALLPLKQIVKVGSGFYHLRLFSPFSSKQTHPICWQTNPLIWKTIWLESFCAFSCQYFDEEIGRNKIYDFKHTRNNTTKSNLATKFVKLRFPLSYIGTGICTDTSLVFIQFRVFTTLFGEEFLEAQFEIQVLI